MSCPCDRSKGLRIDRDHSNCKLVLEELANFLDGEDYVKMQRQSRELVLLNPVFGRQETHYYHSRERAFDRAVLEMVQLLQIFNKLDFTRNADKKYIMRNAAFNQQCPSELHDVLFIPTLEAQATDAQLAKWLVPAQKFSIMGAYAQTELGHGSNIKGLETTAVYDLQTEEFVINSPTSTSIKWWPGSMGHIATHAIVVANLITKEVNHGIHLFMVQLRSLQDHKVLPGIKLGDIGPLFGNNTTNNGYLQLSNVRIPRDDMLMKYAKVTIDGNYIKPVMSKINYASMVYARVMIVSHSAVPLAKAVTIATRYSAVQRQTNHPERRLSDTLGIDYQLQFKLLPLIATVYAFYAAGNFLINMYEDARSEIANNNFHLLPELHATSSGLKSFMSNAMSNGIETCRLACEGLGFSLASGLPTLYTSTTTYETLEGEKTVLYLQTARFLKKQYNKQLLQSQLPENITYLAIDFTSSTCTATISEHFSNSKVLLEAYRQRARTMVEIASLQYQDALEEGLEDSEAWNASSIDWANASQAHCHYVVLRAFKEMIDKVVLCPANKTFLEKLFSLYGVFGVVQYFGDFSLGGYLSTSQLAMARQHFYSLLTVVWPEAVPLVDAFDFPDQLLSSVLGRYDGDIYTYMHKWVNQAPKNKSKIQDIHYRHLGPWLNSKNYYSEL